MNGSWISDATIHRHDTGAAQIEIVLQSGARTFNTVAIWTAIEAQRFAHVVIPVQSVREISSFMISLVPP